MRATRRRPSLVAHTLLPLPNRVPSRLPRRNFSPRRILYALILLLSAYLILGTLIDWLKGKRTQSCITTDEFVRSLNGSSEEKNAVDVSGLSYIALRPRKQPTITRDEYSYDCLEAYFSAAVACSQPGPIEKLDLVFSWVNGSDPLIHQAIHALEAPQDQFGRSTVMPNFFRDHDELRHSMRSVLRHFQGHTSNFHLMTSDVPVPACEPARLKGWSLGQIPQWLNTSSIGAWRDGGVQLHVWHPSQLFPPESQPNFNSLAIETVLGEIPNISEHFVYMNDDFFFLKDLYPADFFSDVFGPVLRVQPNLMVKPERTELHQSVEWAALEYTNGHLSDRFGQRFRPYTTHQAKSLSRPILSELSITFKSDILATQAHPLRGMDRRGDLYMTFLENHYIIERWREGLLWAWVIGKIADVDGSWGEKEAKKAWKEIGGMEGQIELVVRRAEKRETMAKNRVKQLLEQTGHENVDKMRTSYVYSSLDGYPFTGFGRLGRDSWGMYPQEEHKGSFDPTAQCTIEYNECFGWPVTQPANASEVFKRIAFDRNKACGDCIITALVKASGPLGLSAFFSPPERTVTVTGSPAYPPRLPLATRWTDIDFSIQNVIAGAQSRSSDDSFVNKVNIRDWSQQMLHRYRFVIGETPSHFARLRNAPEIRPLIRKLGLEPDDPEYEEYEDTIKSALLCLNDDIPIRNDGKVGALLRDWMAKRWSKQAAWEKGVEVAN